MAASAPPRPASTPISTKVAVGASHGLHFGFGELPAHLEALFHGNLGQDADGEPAVQVNADPFIPALSHDQSGYLTHSLKPV